MGETDYIITIISYVFEAAEVKDIKSFEETIKQPGSIDEEKIMTLAEQWKQEGIEKGRFETSHTIAMNLVKLGLSSQQISESTGLPVEEVEKLQKQIH
jgi:predicted transposase/invertase (TIGR01784 family)